MARLWSDRLLRLCSLLELANRHRRPIPQKIEMAPSPPVAKEGWGNVLQFPSLPGKDRRDATRAADGRCAIIAFPSIAVNEGRVIDTAAADADIATMMKLALHGRSTEARIRACMWLEEAYNVRVM